MNSALVYDSDHQQLVLFGGVGTDFYGDTWLRIGSCWQLTNSAAAPAARSDSGAAFDPNHHQLVLYGGRTPPNDWQDDTWVWAAGWTRRHPVQQPEVTFPLVVFDPVLQKVVLYGQSANATTQTWAWDGTTWQQIVTRASPPARDSAGLAYDPISQKVILFGGETDSGFLGDTWEFDGINWQQLTPNSAPAPRAEPFLATTSQGVVLYGGATAGANPWETWLWNGSTWNIVNTVHVPPSTGPAAGIASVNGAAALVIYRSGTASPEVFMFSQGDWVVT